MLKTALGMHCSDVYIVPGACASAKNGRKMIELDTEKITPEMSEKLLEEVYELADNRSMENLHKTGDDDFSFSLQSMGRFRCSAYKQRGTLAAVLRVVPFGLPDYTLLHIPPQVLELANKRRGLVLVTGPAGSGKSTSLACMINEINKKYDDHIITIEDPIEYLHPHIRSIVSQREVMQDTENYGQALRAALRQAPDVILVGEMRDYETIQTALTAAETGHLVLSTLHTVGAAKTIDRIIDVFPTNRQQQVRVQLSMVLSAVISQQLLPTVDGGVYPAFEIMIVNSAIQNMIRDAKTYQMDNVIYAGAQQGMISMDADILRLYKQKIISRETALLFAANTDMMMKKLI